MDNDPIFVGEGDIDAAREIVANVEDAELFLYPGDQHYFADSSLPSYDADASALPFDDRTVAREALRTLAFDRAATNKIRKAAIAGGMSTARS